MIVKYLKPAIRHFAKNKFLSFVNLVGLLAGITAFLYITHYVSFETSYDKFHEDSENIYRLGLRWFKGDVPDGDLARNFYGAGPAIKNEFPEVEEVARLRPWFGRTLASYEQKKFQVDKIYFADPGVFSVFSFPVISGDPNTALTTPRSIMISESTAKLYFGNGDPLGKVLHLKQGDIDVPHTINGVFEDVPENSHIKFNLLISYANLQSLDNNWKFNQVYTYAKFNERADIEKIKEKVPSFLSKYTEEIQSQGFSVNFIFQPLEGIHLNSNLQSEAEINGDGRNIQFLTLIALVILIIAYVNYVNLTTSYAINRAKEISVKKVLGALKISLRLQHLSEALILNFIAVAGGAFLEWTLFNADLIAGFKEQTGLLIHEPWFWPLAILLIVVGTLLSGLYPALVLSEVNPLIGLKGKYRSSKNGVLLRKGLTFFQFAAAVILIASTLTISRQITFMQDQDLGVDIDQVLVVNAPIIKSNNYGQKLETLKERLLNSSAVTQVAISSEVPGNKISWENTRIHKPGATTDDINVLQIMGVDPDFNKTFDLNIIAGRDFDENRVADRKSFIVNKPALLALGFESEEEALGKSLVWDDRDDGEGYQIIGVLEDYHQTGLREGIKPTILTLDHNNLEYLSIRISTNNMRSALSEIKRDYLRIFRDSTFDYFFLDEHFGKQYEADIQLRKFVTIFTGMALIISCLGLFGMMTLIVHARTKEVAIHKVLGASTMNNFWLLSRDVLVLVFIALLVSIPVSYTLMNSWLANFAFRIDFGLWFFIVPGVAIFMMVFITISHQIIKTTFLDPARTLKDE